MYCTGLYLHWRIVAWIAFVGAFFPVLMTAFWTPESPVWLIHKGQDAKALKSLTYLNNSKYVSYITTYIQMFDFKFYLIFCNFYYKICFYSVQVYKKLLTR